jgi:predicted metalloprotease with PDZ domain
MSPANASRMLRRMTAILGVVAGATTPLFAQGARDTLIYNVAIIPRDAHLTIEARLTLSSPGTLTLSAPPAAGPAGTLVNGLSATDDRGRSVDTRRAGTTWMINVLEPGAVRFRYRLDLHRKIPEGSTSSGMDSTALYAVTRSVFVAPDPTAYRKTGRTYPFIIVHIIAPEGWNTVAGWPARGDDFVPADGEDLLGATIASAPDFRFYRGAQGRANWQLAIRGSRYFTDSALTAAIAASLGAGAALLGPVPQPLVTYTSEAGRKGRTSGSLQGKASVGLVWEPSELMETGRIHDLFHETLHLWFGGAMESERWWIEGVTDYVAARLFSEWKQNPETLAYLCYQSLRNYQGIEHNTQMTMAEENRRRPGGDNTELLVYRKGMLAGLMLDAAIRRATGGRKSLDDLSRQLLALAATRRSHNVRESEIRDAAIAIGGEEADRVWTRVISGTDLITEDDVSAALQTVTGRAFPPPPLTKSRKELAR